VEQLFEAKLHAAQGVRTQFFAVVAGGEAASWTDLYFDGRTAQVEDVATRPEHRGRGFASAVVLRGVEEARMAGCDLVFLVALEDDWPRELYRRLGFDDLGRFTKFPAPPVTSRRARPGRPTAAGAARPSRVSSFWTLAPGVAASLGRIAPLGRCRPRQGARSLRSQAVAPRGGSKAVKILAVPRSSR
jgi:predicted GNAT family acetyltransferase